MMRRIVFGNQKILQLLPIVFVILELCWEKNPLSGRNGGVMAWTTAPKIRRRVPRRKEKQWLKMSSSSSIHTDEEKVVVVVGGGVGGLAISSRIASSEKNTKVIVLEQNDQVGGRCGSFISYYDHDTKSAYRHERGPSLLLLPNVYKELFQDCTSSTDSMFGLEMKQCIPAYQVVFEDGDAISVGIPKGYSEGQQSMEDKMNQFETNGAKKWNDYMEACQAFLDCGLPNFIEERLELSTLPSFLIQALKDNAKSWPLLAHSTVLDATFESTKMKALASFQDLYVGLEPYNNTNQLAGGVFSKTAPAVFGLLSALELHPTNDKAGVFAPIGGFQSVSKSFEALAISLGVDIQCNKTVTGINETHVTYMTCNADKGDDTIVYHSQPSDLTIVNADLPYATQTLLQSDTTITTNNKSLKKEDVLKFDWDDTYDYSSGVVAFHWCIKDRGLAKNNILKTHNVFLIAKDDDSARESWNVVRTNVDDTSCYKKGIFNFYVHCPTVTDPTAAPPNCDSITILVPCPTIQRNKDYHTSKYNKQEVLQKYKEEQFPETLIDEIRSSVLQRLSVLNGLEDLQQHIVHEVVDTPVSYSNSYNLAAGTPFGLSHGFNQLSITRPGTQSSQYDNVLFVGASSRPGNGVPLVLIGAKSVAQKARKKLLQLKPE